MYSYRYIYMCECLLLWNVICKFVLSNKTMAYHNNRWQGLRTKEYCWAGGTWWNPKRNKLPFGMSIWIFGTLIIRFYCWLIQIQKNTPLKLKKIYKGEKWFFFKHSWRTDCRVHLQYIQSQEYVSLVKILI